MWCPGAESNHRHEDFQSSALPTVIWLSYGDKARIKTVAAAGVKSLNGI